MLFYLFDCGGVAVRAELARVPAAGDVVKAKDVAYLVEAVAGETELPVRDGDNWRQEKATKLKVRPFNPFQALAAELPL